MFGAFIAGGCTSISAPAEDPKSSSGEIFAVPQSYLKVGLPLNLVQPIDSDGQDGSNDSSLGENNSKTVSKNLMPLPRSANGLNLERAPGASLSRVDEVSVVAEKMRLRDFVHYVFGELLSVNYVLGASIESTKDVSSDTDTVTLSVNDPMSSRELFGLATKILDDINVKVKVANGTYFVYRDGEGVTPAKPLIGIGRTKGSVPETNQQILQVIPIKFGVKVTMERILLSLGSAKITPDFSQSTIFAEGTREEILRVIDLIDLLDTPATRGRFIGLIELSFMAPAEFTKVVSGLLKNEGIEVAIDKATNQNLVLVPLNRMGAAAVFSTDEFMVERVRYWASVVDVPAKGDEKKFYVYTPNYARAFDLGATVSELLGMTATSAGGQPGGVTGNAPSAKRSGGSSDDGIRLVVDESVNAIVFFASGKAYRGILPLLSKLDVMPRQVMLDILIAEVTLKDEFKHGVEWAFRRGEFSLTTQGAFGASSLGGIGLVVNGKEGPLQANFLATNSLVNVLSNPSLMVRDGTNASINVGSSISVVGATTQDPINGDRETSSVIYRKTGVDVGVDVSINAAGIVVMEITQTISNSVPGSPGAGGNPDIFERMIKTEVLAKSGQTVMLGGLISESSSRGGSGAPVISKIPILGELFKAESRNKDRTELVMLVTPKIIDDLTGWDAVMEDFAKALRYLDLTGG